MPIAGTGHGREPIPGDNPKPFFRDLSQLDAWASEPEGNSTTLLPYIPRNRSDDPYVASRGKLLICHDFKGGYIESPFSLSYTFNFWSTIDIFVYFSHNRVTIPPPSWINAAHRHGVKILGVLIFEHNEDVPDLIRLLSGPDFAIEIDPSAPSEYYSFILADLARQRGFDGFLLNFEQSLPGGAKQANALSKWVRHLREELWKKVGPHAEGIWYDSVTTTGNVHYQNKLNDWNLPFFLSSTGFFANYFWRENYPFDTAEYLLSLDVDTVLIKKDNSSPSDTSVHVLTQREIYIGIDVWGRGSIGGGGFRVHEAMEEICPDSLGLSVGLFGQAWTWEKRQDEVGRTWKAWWDEEVTLWAGKVPALDLNKLLKEQQNENLGYTRPFKPIADFFTKKPPPDPKVLPFFTMLCPGVGKGWWVEGEKVWEGPELEGDDQRWTSGWLDIEKCHSIGDFLWPIPTVIRSEYVWGDAAVSTAALPTAQVSFNMTDAWNGGSSVQLSFYESVEQVPGDSSFWIPVQSISLTPEENYTATAAYKLLDVKNGMAVDVKLEMRRYPGDADGAPEGTYQDASYLLTRGWSGLHKSIKLHSKEENPIVPVELALGLRFNVGGCSSAKGPLFSLSLGQMNIHASQQHWEGDKDLRIDFTSRLGENAVPKTSGLKGLDGILKWSETTPLAEPILSHSRCAYWNVYVLPLTSPFGAAEDKDRIRKGATWVGTSGVDHARKGELGRFPVKGGNLMVCPTLAGRLETADVMRFYARAVVGCGEIAGESIVLYTDVDIKFLK